MNKKWDFGEIHIQGERGSRQFQSDKNTQKLSNIMYSSVDSLLSKKHELEIMCGNTIQVC